MLDATKGDAFFNGLTLSDDLIKFRQSMSGMSHLVYIFFSFFNIYYFSMPTT